MKKLLVVTLFALSCSDEHVQIQSETKDGLLEFNDINQIHSYFENKIGGSGSAQTAFVSFDDIFKRVVSDLDQAQSFEEHAGLLKKYSHVVQLVDSSYVPTISNYLYRTICNPDRLYVASGRLHKVLNNQLLSFRTLKILPN